MRNETRALFRAYCSQIALLNGVPASTEQFNVDPVIEQKLESKMKETSEFLGMINVEPVTQQEGQVLGLTTNRTIAGRTDTSGGTRRNPTDPTGDAQKRRYLCKQTDFDWARSYARMDAWRHRPDFETLLRDAILQQQSRDRIMIGWHGTSAADQTDRVANPLLQDVNIGWLEKIRDNAPGQVFSDGSLTVKTNGTNNAALKAIYVKPGVELFDATAAYDDPGGSATAVADYSSLDALVLDAKRLIPEWWRGDTELVVIVGHDLVDDKYFTIAQTTGADATEVEATDRILRSTKTLGGLPAVRVPFFPAGAMLITRLDNLSIYYQEGTRRRQLKDEPEYNRIANYESVNEAYVVEEYEMCVLVENIVIGGAPARPAP
ncbi:MAG: capsid protein [Novosphingobium sp. 28-62-57]|uniref:phage major capsid protein, P2 family n=1 Tax=unclassified Novosphingobium TaxID=2644732 RepID=UPI000BCB7DDB|nr:MULTISPECIES: phage major capsid protein, P2 family [unclassified Novosphingobium]OYW47340.1 MAG: capsid protein [Novosphingobium sp. 12-63-9]OYZ08008.1 MAG: capsid protein [Novosphingobium sp. 28-62-57]HQS69233.1 phage major capsid protein, P2 family [Novosphingobium sp.]